ncbi:hypothetical protein AUP68_00424 [Ilyonectria robusta]
MPAPSGVRLRDSCQACAASKVKCSKDKPQCNRCAERGTACKYLVTQRTGRKARTRSDPEEDTMQRPTSAHTTAPLSPATLSSLGRGSTPEFSLLDLDTAMLTSSGHGDLSMLPVDLNFASPIQFYANAMDAYDVPTEHKLGSHGGSDGSPDGSSTTEPRIPTQPDIHFLSDKVSLSRQDPGAQEKPKSITDTTACSLPHKQLFQELGNFQTPILSRQPEGIKMALQLMGQLCCEEDSPSNLNVSPSELEYRAHTLVDESRVVTETVNDMLQHPGSEDGYFLAVVCLVMSKVLDAYVKAAQALSACERDGQRKLGLYSSSALSGWSSAGTESASSASPATKGRDPKAVQQLLDDLYQVRTSVNHLGTKIVSVCSKRDWFLGTDLTPSGHDSTLPAFPFSAAVLNQLYDELRRRLSAISLQLINELKQFWV